MSAVRPLMIAFLLACSALVVTPAAQAQFNPVECVDGSPVNTACVESGIEGTIEDSPAGCAMLPPEAIATCVAGVSCNPIGPAFEPTSCPPSPVREILADAIACSTLEDDVCGPVVTAVEGTATAALALVVGCTQFQAPCDVVLEQLEAAEAEVEAAIALAEGCTEFQPPCDVVLEQLEAAEAEVEAAIALAEGCAEFQAPCDGVGQQVVAAEGELETTIALLMGCTEFQPPCNVILEQLEAAEAEVESALLLAEGCVTFQPPCNVVPPTPAGCKTGSPAAEPIHDALCAATGAIPVVGPVAPGMTVPVSESAYVGDDDSDGRKDYYVYTIHDVDSAADTSTTNAGGNDGCGVRAPIGVPSVDGAGTDCMNAGKNLFRIYIRIDLFDGAGSANVAGPVDGPLLVVENSRSPTTANLATGTIPATSLNEAIPYAVGFTFADGKGFGVNSFAVQDPRTDARYYLVADMDNDGDVDFEELLNCQSNPSNPASKCGDPDGDGSDSGRSNLPVCGGGTVTTDANWWDTDGDGRPDNTDACPLDPTNGDPDKDGLDSFEEIVCQTNPNVKDSDGDDDGDGDGNLPYNDGQEAGSDRTFPCNNNGLNTSPHLADTDGDGQADGPRDPDGAGPKVRGVDPAPLDATRKDTDLDTMLDSEETSGVFDYAWRTTQPSGADKYGVAANHPGIKYCTNHPANGASERRDGQDGPDFPDTNPDVCTAPSAPEGRTNPTDSDTDNDGLTDGMEVIGMAFTSNACRPNPAGTRSDPNNVDTDADGYDDNAEDCGAFGLYTLGNPEDYTSRPDDGQIFYDLEGIPIGPPEDECDVDEVIGEEFFCPAPCPPVDSDGDGVCDADDECPGTPPGTEVDDTGCEVQPFPPGPCDIDDSLPVICEPASTPSPTQLLTNPDCNPLNAVADPDCQGSPFGEVLDNRDVHDVDGDGKTNEPNDQIDFVEERIGYYDLDEAKDSSAEHNGDLESPNGASMGATLVLLRPSTAIATTPPEYARLHVGDSGNSNTPFDLFVLEQGSRNDPEYVTCAYIEDETLEIVIQNVGGYNPAATTEPCGPSTPWAFVNRAVGDENDPFAYGTSGDWLVVFDENHDGIPEGAVLFLPAGPCGRGIIGIGPVTSKCTPGAPTPIGGIPGIPEDPAAMLCAEDLPFAGTPVCGGDVPDPMAMICAEGSPLAGTPACGGDVPDPTTLPETLCEDGMPLAGSPACTGDVGLPCEDPTDPTTCTLPVDPAVVFDELCADPDVGSLLGEFDLCPEGEPAPDSDGDGVPNADDLCPGTTAGVQVNDDGCPDADGDGVADTDDECANTPADTEVDENGCPTGLPLPCDPTVDAEACIPADLLAEVQAAIDEVLNGAPDPLATFPPCSEVGNPREYDMGFGPGVFACVDPAQETLLEKQLAARGIDYPGLLIFVNGASVWL